MRYRPYYPWLVTSVPFNYLFHQYCILSENIFRFKFFRKVFYSTFDLVCSGMNGTEEVKASAHQVGTALKAMISGSEL